MMAPQEQAAHDTILSWCRSGKRGIGHPVMRGNVRGFLCVVLNLAKSEPVPGGYDWETRDKIEAAGNNWEEVLSQLRRQGAEL